MSADHPAPTWRDRFPFVEPYKEQKDAIDQIIETGKKNGFTVMEKACGGGKTQDALQAGIELVRDPSTKYERVVALTSVKQQLRAFEDDLEAINKNLPGSQDPVSGLTLVGKADVCSYVESGDLSSDNIYGRCNELREPVKAKMGKAPSDQEREKVLSGMIEEMEVDSLKETDHAVEGGDWVAPYKKSDLDETEFCAFYANYRLKQLQKQPLLDINGMMTPTDVVQQASERGVCPHAAVGHTLDTAELVIANYKHAFDPITVGAYTSALIDDSTFLVCDEAHMLVPSVRDELSDDVSLRTIRFAINEVNSEILNQDNDDVEDIIREEFGNRGIDPDDAEPFLHFLQKLRQKIEDLAIDALEMDNPEWQETVFDDFQNGNEIEYALRDPESFHIDELTQWADKNGHLDVMEQSAVIGEAIGEALTRAKDELGYSRMETYSDIVGRVMGEWYHNDHQQYFREVVLETRDQRKNNTELYWNEFYTPKLKLLNTIPFKEIANRVDEFGGGLLMSATLYPLGVYEKETGLAALRDLKGRPVNRLVYGLNFPKENRASFAVNSTKFTYSNRGSQYEGSETRDEYEKLIKDVVRNTDGNILIGMPSYSEAEWVEYFLDQDYSINKPVRADESSSVEETEELKSWFFSDGPKVLTTSVKGTLTEGVDYDGDKLKACVVVGVPYPPTNSPATKARVAAYEAQFSNGFDMALTVPAIRKSRQALGRVIRGDDEKGVRVLLDGRYADDSWKGVRKHLPDYEREDYTPIEPDELEDGVKNFWMNNS